jgi:hypothetical protein
MLSLLKRLMSKPPEQAPHLGRSPAAEVLTCLASSPRGNPAGCE